MYIFYLHFIDSFSKATKSGKYLKTYGFVMHILKYDFYGLDRIFKTRLLFILREKNIQSYLKIKITSIRKKIDAPQRKFCYEKVLFL